MVARQSPSPARVTHADARPGPRPAGPWHALARSPRRLLALVGGYGSGKTEVAVNLALELAAGGTRVQLADLDLVNPYFRCREALELLEAHGVRVVAPPGGQASADLPIVLPEVLGLLDPPAGTLSLLDVGGDDVGARALAALRPRIPDGRHELWLVVNGRRPYSATTEACQRMRDQIEAAARLAVTGLVLNTHLGDETTPDVVLEGWRLGLAVAERLGVPVRCVTVIETLAGAAALQPIDAPRLVLRRRMLPPWIPSRPPAPRRPPH